MARYVLDAFALMALFMDESGSARVEALLEQAKTGDHEVVISTVNLGEVLYSIERRRGSTAAEEALASIELSGIRVIDVDRALAFEAARIKATMRIDYLDSFVTALAQQLGATVVTGDPDFREVEGIVDVEWLT